jgi:hypothetical protein
MISDELDAQWAPEIILTLRRSGKSLPLLRIGPRFFGRPARRLWQRVQVIPSNRPFDLSTLAQNVQMPKRSLFPCQLTNANTCVYTT